MATVEQHFNAGTLPAPDDLEGIARRMRLAREQAGLSQQEFAVRLGYSRRQVVAWETAANTPPVWVLIAIRRECDVDPEWILSGPGDVPVSDVPPSERQRLKRLKREIEEMTRSHGLSLPEESVNTLVTLLQRAPVNAEGEAKSEIMRMLRDISRNARPK